MEKYEVLNKLFEITHKMKKNKKSSGQDSELSEFMELITKMDLRHSARRTLHLLYTNENMNQRALANCMDISAQAVSDIINKLHGYELVEKVAGTQNNENIILLTEKGLHFSEKLVEVIVRDSNKIFELFSEEEVNTFYELLHKLNI